MYNILNTLKSLEPTPEQKVKAEAKRIYESVEAQGSITAGVSAVEAKLAHQFAESKLSENGLQRYTGIKKYGKDGFEALQAAGREGASEEEKGRIKDKYLPKNKVKEDEVPVVDQGEYDREGDMVKDNLATIQREVEELMAQLHDDENVPEWVEDKIAQVKGMMTSTSEYMQTQHERGQKHEMDESDDNYWEEIQDIMRKYGLSKQEALEYYYYERDDAKDWEDMERQDAKDMKEGTIHKGTYGTEYDPGEDDTDAKEKRKNYKHRVGVKGRKPNEKPAKAELPADPFGRTTGDVPKGKKGTRIKGKGNIDEVITKKTSAGEIIHDFQKSKNPKFAGKSPEQRKQQALGAYYGMHPKKSNKKESMREGTDYKKQNFLFESFNFANMMKEQDQTVQEMLTELQSDIANFKMTGECSPKLDAFLRIHGHNKKQLADEAKMPKVLDKIGSAVKTGWEKLSHPDDDAMLDKLYKDTLPPGASSAPDTAHDELDELAQLAGITDEGNAFTGKLAKTPHGDSFELDGKKYKDTSQLDEAMCNECGMYESQCSCTEGNLFTKKLAQTPKGGKFELDGKKYKDTSNLDEGTCPTCHADPCECEFEEGNEFSGELAKARAQHKDHFSVDGHEYPVKESTTLEDIAKLAGIAVEGKDYGDTTYPEAPTYDNTPDEQVQGEDVLLKGGDGEVAGMEKKMAKDGAARFSDNPLAMKESETKATDLMKEAATFDPIEAMGRKLMKQYESIKLQK
jgi:hypothetical protein